MQNFRIRPHHGLCIAFFEGKGYSRVFTENMQKIIAVLEKSDPFVTLTLNADIICAKCPNNSNGICTSTKPDIYDEKVLKNIGLTENSRLKWSSFRDMMYHDIIANDRLSKICSDCKWYSICSIKSTKADVQ